MKKILPIYLILMLTFSIAYSGSPRISLVEEATSAYCGACVSQNPAFYQTLRDNAQYAIPIIYHSGNAPGDPLYKHNPTMVGNRIWGTYVSGTLGTPAAWVNGTKIAALSTVFGEIAKYKHQTSPITMHVIQEESEGTISVNVIVETDEALTGDKRLFFVVCEEELHINVPGSTERDFYWTARAMFPGALPTQGVPINMEAGETRTFSQTIQRNSEWLDENYYVVAFIQDMGKNKEVLQAAKTYDGPIEPKIAVSANKLDFNKVDTEKTLSLEIQNDGLGTLEITDIVIQDDEFGVYKLIDEPNFSIGPYSKKSVEVNFKPKDNVYYNALLKVHSNDKTAAVKTIQLTGIGYGVTPNPEIVLETELVEFGNISDMGEYDLVIKNSGYASLEISNISIMDDFEDVFSIKFEGAVQIEKEQQKAFKLKFAPHENKEYNARLKIESNDPKNGTIYAYITGTGEGVTTYAIIEAIGGTLEFGNASEKISKEIEITNSGYKTLKIDQMMINGDQNGVFKIITEKTIELNHNDKQKIEVSFTPTENKEYAAELIIKSNADNYSEINVPLTGTGSGIVSVNEASNIDLNISLRQNPVSDVLIFDIVNNKEPGDISFELMDILGRRVANSGSIYLNGGINVFSLPVPNIPAGNYIAVSTFNGKMLILKIIIVK